ncbi:hypothetical protein [Leeuwenhoekiella sp. ZYFB001]|uniref:hypothetical protein n=1 Tax=Leeuwenhoekiella sp. ZYFB001 TaxID=2719912 RepID=UPI00142FB10A|nr:hypothetical protein [Leeuwenhoekiella sp. ZYFB001]
MKTFTPMLKLSFLLSLFLIPLISNAQVGIGTTNPAGGSLLDIESAEKGILIPRVDIADLSTQAPVTGDLTSSESLLVYNTNTTTGKGFYYWDGTQWVAVGGTGENIYTTDGSLPETRTVNLDENILRFDNGVGRYLNLEGASVSDNNDPFLFTTFNALRFDIDNDPVLTLDNNQDVGIGLADPQAKLHIFENSGTPASPSDGTIVLEHGDAGGSSSIVFKSRSNNNSDYGYLNFSDNGSGNGSTNENALLEIGIQNDGVNQYQDDINIASTGNVGISNTAPQEKLHISGNTSTIRVDGLNRANNASNVQNDPMPVYVDDNGTMILRPSLVQTYMPVNRVDFLTGNNNTVTSGFNTGASVDRLLLTETITLTQTSLVQVIYFYSVSITRRNGDAITDGAPRLFRGWVTINNTAEHLAYDTGTYTNGHDPDPNSQSNYAAGYYYLNGTSYVELPAGTHTFRLYGRGFGSQFDFQMIFGASNYDRFQIIVHR